MENKSQGCIMRFKFKVFINISSLHSSEIFNYFSLYVKLERKIKNRQNKTAKYFRKFFCLLIFFSPILSLNELYFWIRGGMLFTKH